MYHFKNIGVKNMIVCQFVDIKSLYTQSGGKQTQNFLHIDIDANKNWLGGLSILRLKIPLLNL